MGFNGISTGNSLSGDERPGAGGSKKAPKMDTPLLDISHHFLGHGAQD
jgi:hypothetical protein